MRNEKATITTAEGTINIIDKVPCTINGEPVKNNRKGGVTTKSVSKMTDCRRQYIYVK